MHIPGEGRSRVLPKRLGSQSSSVYSKLLAAEPAVFTRIRLVCKLKCQTSCPRDSLLAHPQLLSASPRKERGDWKQEELAPGSLTPPLSPPQRQEFLGRADGPPPLPPPSRSGVSRAGKTSTTSLSPAQSPECPHTVVTGTTEGPPGGWGGEARRGVEHRGGCGPASSPAAPRLGFGAGPPATVSRPRGEPNG